MYNNDTKITELTVKELKELIRTEVALLIPNERFYNYTGGYTVHADTKSRPIYPDPFNTPYCGNET